MLLYPDICYFTLVEIEAQQALTDIGNGQGLLYITEADGTTLFVDGIPNTQDSKVILQEDAVESAPLAGEITGVGGIEFSGTHADITALTVNAVPIITGTITDTGTIAGNVLAAADNINTTISSPKYYAQATGAILLIKATGQGSNANGYVVAIGTTMTTAVLPITGGTSPSDTVDEATGHRYFLNANYTTSPSPTSLTGAIEITQYLVMRGMQGAQIIQAQTIASNILAPVRQALNMNVTVETEGGAGTDTLNTILTVGFAFGDIITLTGVNPAHVVTVKNYTSGNDNIYLAGGDFVTGGADVSITLQYINYNGGTWQELYRTPAVNLSVASQRAAGLPTPVSGVNITTLTNGGGTINVEPGVDNGYQVYLGGSLNLSGNQVIQIKAIPTTPYLDGDVMTFDYRATNNTGSSSTVTIGGILLTTTQAQNGRVIIKATYSLDTTTWYYSFQYSSAGLDLVDKVAADVAYQAYLPTPTGNGFVWVVNTDRTTSAIPFPQGMGIQYTEVTIPSVQVLTLNSVPFQLIAAPADSSQSIEVIKISAEIVNGGAVTAYSSQAVSIITATANRLQYSISNELLLSTVVRRIFGVIQIVSNATDTQLIAGQALMATTAADPTTGNSDIKFRILYQVS